MALRRRLLESLFSYRAALSTDEGFKYQDLDKEKA
jgi:hypothetical protein